MTSAKMKLTKIVLGVVMIAAFIMGALGFITPTKDVSAEPAVTPKQYYTIATTASSGNMTFHTLSSNNALALEEGESVYFGYKVKAYTGIMHRQFGLAMFTQLGGNYKPYGTGTGIYYYATDTTADTNAAHAQSLIDAGAQYDIVFTRTASGFSYVANKTIGGQTTQLTFASTEGSLEAGASVYFGIYMNTEAGSHASTGFKGLEIENAYCCTADNADLGIKSAFANRGTHYTIARQVPAWQDKDVVGYSVTQKTDLKNLFYMGSVVPASAGDTIYLTYKVVSSTENTAPQSGIVATTQSWPSNNLPHTTGSMKYTNSSVLLDSGYTYKITFYRCSETEWLTSVVKDNGTDAIELTTWTNYSSTLPNDANNYGIWFTSDGEGSLKGLVLENVKCYNQDGENLGIKIGDVRNSYFDVVAELNWQEKDVQAYSIKQKASQVGSSFYFGSDADLTVGNKVYLTYYVNAHTSNSSAQSGIIATSATGANTSHPFNNGNGYMKFTSSNVMYDLGYTYKIIYYKENATTLKYSVTKIDALGVETEVAFSSEIGAVVADTLRFGVWFSEGSGNKLMGLSLENVKCYDDSGNDLGVMINDVHYVTNQNFSITAVDMTPTVTYLAADGSTIEEIDTLKYFDTVTLKDAAANNTVLWYDGVNAYTGGEEVRVFGDTTYQAVNVDIRQGGAYIRVVSPAGLRFRSLVKTSDWETVLQIADENSLESGTLIIPENVLGGIEFTEAALGAASKVAGTDYKKVVNIDNAINEEVGEDSAFYGSIVNIQEHNYHRNFCARSYVKFAINGQEILVYSDIQTKNVYQVSKAYVEDNSTTIPDSRKPVIFNYLNGVVKMDASYNVDTIAANGNGYASNYAVESDGTTVTVTATAVSGADVANVKVIVIGNAYYYTTDDARVTVNASSITVNVA